MPVEPQDPNRLSWETLIEGTNEKLVHAFVPGRDSMQYADTDALIRLGTPLKQTRFANFQSCHPTWKDYILSEIDPRTQDGSLYTKFTFARVYTTPGAPIFSQFSTDRYTWPPVVRYFQFESSELLPLTVTAISGVTRGVGTLPRWFLHMDREAARSGTWTVKINHYLSNSPFPQALYERYQQPDPGEINWDLAGHSDSFDALHSGVEVPIQGDSVNTLVGGSPASLGSGIQQYRKIPPTNMRDWAEFALDHTDRFVGGVYHMIERVIQPPPRRRRQPPKIISL